MTTAEAADAGRTVRKIVKDDPERGRFQSGAGARLLIATSASAFGSPPPRSQKTKKRQKKTTKNACLCRVNAHEVHVPHNGTRLSSTLLRTLTWNAVEPFDPIRCLRTSHGMFSPGLSDAGCSESPDSQKPAAQAMESVCNSVRIHSPWGVYLYLIILIGVSLHSFPYLCNLHCYTLVLESISNKQEIILIADTSFLFFSDFFSFFFMPVYPCGRFCKLCRRSKAVTVQTIDEFGSSQRKRNP